MAVDLVWLGVALLLAPALGEVAKIRARADKGFALLAIAGVMYLLAVAFSYDLGFGITTIFGYGTMLFAIIGFIATLIGAILVLINAFK